MSEYQKSIPQLIGKRAVITLDRLELVTPIESGAQACHELFEKIRATFPNAPVAEVFDGWTRCEYGRPMTSLEIDEALANSGH